MNAPNEDFEVKLEADGHGWTLEWEWIGEGNCGDFNPDDPEDKQRLRATLWVDGKRVSEGSYCTLATTSTPRKELEEGAMRLLNSVSHLPVKPGIFADEVHVSGAKRIMQEWTWRKYTQEEGG